MNLFDHSGGRSSMDLVWNVMLPFGEREVVVVGDGKRRGSTSMPMY